MASLGGQVIDESTGESVGFCDSETLYRFIVPMHTIHMIPVSLSGLMAWKTKGFDASYSDSNCFRSYLGTITSYRSQTQIVISRL